jgi:hypothetical protein
MSIGRLGSSVVVVVLVVDVVLVVLVDELVVEVVLVVVVGGGQGFLAPLLPGALGPHLSAFGAASAGDVNKTPPTSASPISTTATLRITGPANRARQRTRRAPTIEANAAVTPTGVFFMCPPEDEASTGSSRVATRPTVSHSTWR